MQLANGKDATRHDISGWLGHHKSSGRVIELADTV